MSNTNEARALIQEAVEFFLAGGYHLPRDGHLEAEVRELLGTTGTTPLTDILNPPFVERYQAWVESIWSSSNSGKELDLKGLFVCTTGLAGEVGEVQELLVRELATIAECSTMLGKETSDVVERIKKHVRNDRELAREEMVSELGDVLYYLTRIASWQGLRLEEIMRANHDKVCARYNKGKTPAPRVESSHVKECNCYRCHATLYSNEV